MTSLGALVFGEMLILIIKIVKKRKKELTMKWNQKNRRYQGKVAKKSAWRS